MIKEIEKIAEEREKSDALSGWNPVETLPENDPVVAFVERDGKRFVVIGVKILGAWSVLKSSDGKIGVFLEMEGVKGWMPMI